MKIAQETWKGAHASTGKHLFHGVTKGTPLKALIGTDCHDNETCFGRPFPMFPEWIRLFIKKDPYFDPSTITTQREYEKIFHGIGSGI
jgi:feruloyl esterase